MGAHVHPHPLGAGPALHVVQRRIHNRAGIHAGRIGTKPEITRPRVYKTRIARNNVPLIGAVI